MVNEAWPVASTGTVCIGVVPSRKVTVPVSGRRAVACPALSPNGVTEAVNVTSWPTVTTLGARPSCVTVVAFWTSNDRLPVLPASFGPPLYVAVTSCWPAVRTGVTSTAEPRDTVVVPRSVPVVVSKKSTVPDDGRLFEVPVTVATRVITPTVGEFGRMLIPVLVGVGADEAVSIVKTAVLGA